MTTIRRGDENEIAKHVSPNFSKKLCGIRKLPIPKMRKRSCGCSRAFRADPRKCRLRNLKLNGD